MQPALTKTLQSTGGCGRAEDETVLCGWGWNMAVGRCLMCVCVQQVWAPECTGLAALQREGKKEFVDSLSEELKLKCPSLQSASHALAPFWVSQ
jgi:hypothetical protein